jgi:peroxiredoxin
MISFRITVVGLAITASLASTGAQTARGQANDAVQQDPAQPKPKVLTPANGGATVQSINDDYNRQLLQLERQRLERLSQLAARQPAKEADETYEQLFRLAVANNLFTEAEPAAQQVLKAGNRSSVVVFLARTVDLIASADRGAYDESVAELRKLSDAKRAGQTPAASLDTAAVLTICEAYYQRLLQGDRFDTARTAFRLVLQESANPAVKAFCTSHLNQLDMIGKPAPAIQGTDLDGKPVSLADMKGNVVLVNFWASWCMPSSAEFAWLDEAYNTFNKRGFRILGINVDTMQNDHPKLDTLLPSIRRFLVDHNVRWPNLLNGTGALDYAHAYGVAEIPSSVLIGRDGNVIHLDLSRKNLNSVIARSLGP